MILLGLTFSLALLLSLYGVPMARRAALKFGIVDGPDGRLKHQREPVPYLGGLAIYLAFLMSLAFTFDFRQEVLGILLAGTLVMVLGLIDDFGVLTPWQKLFGQVLAVFVLIKSGVRIQIVVFPDWLDLLLTVIWMLGIINAFNLVDIMDGLSASIGLVGATLLSVVAILNGDTTIAFLGVALAGSLVGFLRYNFHPAKIYMGDAGALFLGLMLGALAMIGEYSTNHPVSVLTPVFILGVPIFDMMFVMYIRWLRGLPVFLGSPDHVPLRLRHWGMTVPQVVILSAIATGVMGSIGLALMVVTSETAWMMVGATLVGGGVLVLLLRRVDVSAPGTGALEQAAVSEGQGGKSRV